VADVKRVLREQHVDCPVIYCAGSSQIVALTKQPDYVAPQAREWNIRGVPATFLVDPQGVVVAKHLRRELAPAALDYFLNLDTPYPPVGLRTSFTVQDGEQVVLRLEVSNPRRTPLQLEVNYALVEADIIEFHGMTIPSNRRRHNPVEGGPE
jgi:hypothetical protein